MQFTTQRSGLAEVVGLVGQVVSSKSTKRIFECLRLVAGKDGLEVSGTDLEVAVRCRLRRDLEVVEDGEAVVPAHLFAGILREIGDESVSIRVAKRKLTIETDGGHFELECEDPAQFPQIPAVEGNTVCTVATADLATLVRRTVFAAGKEAARFVLNGVRLTLEGDVLRCVATDGRRLATVARPIGRKNGSEGRDLSAIVGVKGLQHFDRLTSRAGDAVELVLSERFVALRSEDAEAVVRVMDGTFPDTSQIVPERCEAEASLPVSVFMSRLRQVAQFTSVDSQAVVLSFRPGELGMSAAGGVGRAEVRIGIDYDGEEARIGFNPAFLLDGLKVVDEETIRFGFNNPNAAARLADNSGFVYVVMPVLVE